MHRWAWGSLGALPAAALAVGLAVSPAAPAAAQASGTWSKTGSMTTPRQGQTATLLANGQVLVISGGSAGGELYNPAMGKWTATGSPAAPASGYTATLLPNGQVLLVSRTRVFAAPREVRPAPSAWSADCRSCDWWRGISKSGH